MQKIHAILLKIFPYFSASAIYFHYPLFLPWNYINSNVFVYIRIRPNPINIFCKEGGRLSCCTVMYRKVEA